MKYIGAHVSTEGGVANAPLEAVAIGARSFALFTGSSNRWTSRSLKEKDIEDFKENCRLGGYTPDVILPHDNFLINLGSPDPQKLEMSRQSFLEEMKRCEQLGLTMLNFHPGSHLNEIEVDRCLDLIAESINMTLDKTDGVSAILESTAGQGSNLGYRFEHLAHIIDKIEDKTRVGVCVDTCHTFSAGYDLAGEDGYRITWEEFDNTVGASYLKAIHLNDDLKKFASRVDRHAEIGKGTLGLEFFRRFVNDPRFDNMPIVLETPNPAIWPQEIKLLYSMME